MAQPSDAVSNCISIKIEWRLRNLPTCLTTQLGVSPENTISAPRDAKGESWQDFESAQAANLGTKYPGKATELTHFLGCLAETPFRPDCVVGPGGLEPPTRPLLAVGS